MEIDKILDFLKQVQQQKEECLVATVNAELRCADKPKNRSSELNELFAALAKAQSEMETAGLDSSNPYYKSKYADLVSVVNASRPYLTKNGLSVIQQVCVEEGAGRIMLHSILGHSSGQWIESSMNVVPVKNDPQSFGSCISYLRRYSYAALVGVVAGNDDDDGNVASNSSKETDNKPTTNAQVNVHVPISKDIKLVKPLPIELISPSELAVLQHELDGFSDIEKEVITKMELNELSDMPKSKYNASLKRIQAIKEAKKDIY